MSVQAPKNLWRALVGSVVIVFAYAALLPKVSRAWRTNENYSHGLLIPFVILYSLWNERNRLAARPARPSALWGALAILFSVMSPPPDLMTALTVTEAGPRSTFIPD